MAEAPPSETTEATETTEAIQTPHESIEPAAQQFETPWEPTPPRDDL
jgi:hypothetical protein